MVASQFATWTRLAKEANISIIVDVLDFSFTETAVSDRGVATYCADAGRGHWI